VASRLLPTVSVQVVRAVFAEAARRGQELAALCARFGVPREQLADDEARVGVQILRRIWMGLPQLVNMTGFGVAAAGHLQQEAMLSIVGHALRAAPSLGEGLRMAQRHQRLLTDALATRRIVSAGEVRIMFEERDRAFRLPPQAVELALASILFMVRGVAASPVTPLRIELRHARPPDDAMLRGALGCRIVYGAPTDAIVFSQAQLEAPQASADPLLASILEQHTRAIEERLPERSTFAVRTRRALGEALPSGATGLDEVASRMGLSRRTVQRRLQMEGTSHQRVLDDLRRDLATRYLAERELDIHEIAFVLGFSDQSAFHHAFVRWMGKAPGAYRKKPS
jgi:AraC-like DNA-binding protein